jgi:hypothetical protein
MMTARERVTLTMRHKTPDRVPRYDIFLPGFDEALRKLPGREGLSAYDYYDEVDIGAILADQGGPFIAEACFLRREEHKKIERDSWGRTLLTHTNGYFEQVLDVAVAEKGDLETLDFSPKLDLRPAPDKQWLDGLNKRFCTVSGCMGLFMGAWRLRGEAQLLEDMADDPAFVHALVSRTADFLTALGLHTAIKTHMLDTAIWVYDELSSRLGPLFSPAMFETYFLLPYQRMFAAWRMGGIRHIILHCDGNSLPLLDLLMAAGFTGIQSMAPTSGMYLPDVKKRVGNRLVLIGGMDNIETLVKGTPQEIEKQTREVLEAAKDGGVIVGTHSIDSDIPVKNYDVYDAVMRRYGRIMP